MYAANQTSRFGQRITLGDLLHQCAKKYEWKPFVTQAETGECLSYAEFDSKVNRLAHGIRSAFPNTSNHVSIMLETNIEYLAFTYALKKLNLVEVSINRAFRGQSLSRMINLTRSETLVTSTPHFDALKAVEDQLSHISNVVVLDGFETATKRFPTWNIIPWSDLVSTNCSHISSNARDTDVAAIMFTSGTTGVSKGCMLSHRLAVRTAENMIRPFRLTADDINYTPYPLSHIGPAYYDILPMMLVGGQAVIRDGFSLSAFWPEIIRYGCTWFMCLGSVQQLLYSAAPKAEDKQHCVTRCWATPAPVPAEQFEARFGLHLMPGGGYGSTDAGWVVVPQWDHPGGVVLPHYEIRIVDVNGDKVPAGKPGELLIRPLEPGVMSDGYFGMHEATLESRRNLWFHTGDIGSVDAEGLFYFHCRKSERLRVKGEMINAFEIEEAVLLHHTVEDAAAVGAPADYGEEQVHLFVTAKPGQMLKVDVLLAHCKEHLARFMVPSNISILDDMPRTPTGKVEKGILREIACKNINSKTTT